MPGGQALGDMFQRDGHVIDLSRVQRLRPVVTLTMGQVEHAKGQARHPSIGMHIHQPRGDLSHRPVGADAQMQPGITGKGQPLLGNVDLETQAPGIVAALIDRGIAGLAVAAPFRLCVKWAA